VLFDETDDAITASSIAVKHTDRCWDIPTASRFLTLRNLESIGKTQEPSRQNHRSNPLSASRNQFIRGREPAVEFSGRFR